jgi:hypothetical protein
MNAKTDNSRKTSNCSAIHGALTPEQCGCSGCRRELSLPKTDVNIDDIKLVL